SRQSIGWRFRSIDSTNRGYANFLTESACAVREMFLIKRPFSGCQSIRGRLHLWQNQRKGRILQKSPPRGSRDRSVRFAPRRRTRKEVRVVQSRRDLRRNPENKPRSHRRFCWA